jgi:ribosomal protein RSM22 (predicted rRNA methylase)
MILSFENLIKGVSLKELAKEQERLTLLYRQRGPGAIPPLSSDLQRLAYLFVRFPATQAALIQVFTELRSRAPHFTASSFLDVGAGPGTALFAAQESGLSVKRATLIERDPGFIALGKRLSEDLEGVEWIHRDVCLPLQEGVHDLVVASYMLNELQEKERASLVDSLWARTGQFLVLVEAGSRLGYALLLQLRERLLSGGAHLIAPCPHARACPLSGEEWCHFSARLARSSMHRKIKGAERGFEDEKFFYLIFSKNPLETSCVARVIKRPVQGKGFVRLSLCQEQGIEEKTFTKKNKELYARAKKAGWGSNIDLG